MVSAAIDGAGEENPRVFGLANLANIAGRVRSVADHDQLFLDGDLFESLDDHQGVVLGLHAAHVKKIAARREPEPPQRLAGFQLPCFGSVRNQVAALAVALRVISLNHCRIGDEFAREPR